MSDAENPEVILAKHLLEDSTLRIRYQHEFSLAGFQSLILINGGAIIGLLTYAGNRTDTIAAHHLSGAFISYVIGLAGTILAYLFAYYSQGLFMSVETHDAFKRLGFETEKPVNASRNGKRCVIVAVSLTIAGLVAFVVGSWLAMSGIS